MKVDQLQQEKDMLGRLHEAEMKSAIKGDEIAGLLREAMNQAEIREKQATAEIQSVRHKLDDMKSRAEQAEQALVKVKEEFPSKEKELRVETANNGLLANPTMRGNENSERDMDTLKQDLEQAKKDLQAANNRADGLLDLLHSTYSLASIVIAATHVLHKGSTHVAMSWELCYAYLNMLVKR
ncbi:uncharacterized protein IUM83_04398 [Phytophthora cinnamomi]|uniref:uncharacterized protein n=1 Tax=Phytophthora cinnamomi TaxID=4785 RepID=UPI00355A557C|nr:hypothetical protein IUM83_04398 [Phytophthora cinnamomi]